jgi:hypothetical protein
VLVEYVEPSRREAQLVERLARGRDQADALGRQP